MVLNQSDSKQLEKIVKGLESTLEITDLYISSKMVVNLKRIIKKLEDEKSEQVSPMSIRPDDPIKVVEIFSGMTTDSESSKNIEIKKLNYEIQCWLEGPPKTLSRYRKFYESIISIHLGGIGIMKQHHSKHLEGAEYKELKKLWQNYKINYPGKDNEN